MIQTVPLPLRKVCLDMSFEKLHYSFQERKEIGRLKASLFNLQKGLCGCCNSKLVRTPTRLIHLDHSHINGAIRGLVCSSCNRTISVVEAEPHRANYKRYKIYTQYLDKSYEDFDTVW